MRPEVRLSMEAVADALAKQHPGTVLYFLDANFPFFDGYPLQPHFSHRYGTTVDVALCWLHKGKPLHGAPIPLAYGASEPPLPGEVDMEAKCRNWLRSFEYRTARHFYEAADYQLDTERTRTLLTLFAKQKTVRKMLLEPHLKIRLGLGGFDKIRFQRCKAARHDDHVHVIWLAKPRFLRRKS